MNSLTEPKRWERYVWPFLAAAVLLLLWHFLVRWSHTRIFPSPLDVTLGMTELFQKGLVWHYILDSLRRVALGYLFAALLAVPSGLLLGWYPAIAAVVDPAVQMIRPISPIAWIPVSILWFGVGEHAATFLIFLASFFPILVASMNGVRNIPSMYPRAGRNFGLLPIRLLARVIFPAALPQIIIG